MACQDRAHTSHTTIADLKGIFIKYLIEIPFGKCHLSKSVSKRISKTSSNEQIFKESIPIYEEALKKSGFHEKLEYVRKEVDKHGREKKKRRK